MCKDPNDSVGRRPDLLTLVLLLRRLAAVLAVLTGAVLGFTVARVAAARRRWSAQRCDAPPSAIAFEAWRRLHQIEPTMGWNF